MRSTVTVMHPCRLPALRRIRCCHGQLQAELRLVAVAGFSARPPPCSRYDRLQVQHRRSFHTQLLLSSGLFRQVLAAAGFPSSPAPASLSQSQRAQTAAASAPSAASASAAASAFLDPDFPRVPLATNSSYRAAAIQSPPAQAADHSRSALSPAPVAAASSPAPLSQQLRRRSVPRRAGEWARTLRWRFFKARARLRERASAERWETRLRKQAKAAWPSCLTRSAR